VKTLLLTGYDDAFAPLGKLTEPLMLAYAKRQGFTFACMREGLGNTEHPSWWKMRRLLSAFDLPPKSSYSPYHDGSGLCDHVIWMDADMVITNPHFVPPGESGYHCSRDWGQDATEPWMLTNCCFAAFPDSLPLIRWVLEHKDDYSCEFHEQNHVREAARGPFKGVIHVHPSRVFSAVPVEIHPSVREPWRPGDWAAHLTMVPLAERVRLAREFIKRTKGAW